MSRILAVDYGRKRCGIAVSDPERIIAGGLTTVGSGELVDFIRDYASKEDVGVVVVGYPRNDNGTDSASMEYIKQFLNRMRKVMPEMPIEMVDERYTTKMAFQAMLDGGIITIGSNTQIGPNSQFLTPNHPINHVERRKPIERCSPITIGEDCWLGGGVTVCPGVTIGDRCIIGAGSVVVEDIPSDSMAVGNPCRVIRKIKS